MQKVTLLAFNDFHRTLEPLRDGSGGAARLVGKLRQLQEQNPEALVVNVGDVAGDNKEPGPQAFAPIPELFNRAGVDVMTLGNHEFEDPQGDYQSLREGLIQPLEAEVLCANVQHNDDGEPIQGTKPFTIKRALGYTIGFIGLVTRNLVSRMFPSAGAGLAVAPLEATLKDLVPQVSRQADAVVVLGHENLRVMTELTQETPGVDVSLAAHDHKLTTQAVEVVRPDGSKGYVSESGAYGQNINQIDLFFSPQSHDLVKVEVNTHKIDDSSPVDAQAAEIVRNAPQLKDAAMPEEDSHSEIRLGSFKELSKFYNAKEGSQSS